MPDLLDLSNQALVYKSRKVRETNMEEVKITFLFWIILKDPNEGNVNDDDNCRCLELRPKCGFLT